MRLLITGQHGAVGRHVAARLQDAGHELVGFDLIDGQDLLDHAAVCRAVAGCQAVVHLGAVPHDSAADPERIMAVNVLGTWHVLLAAEQAAARFVVHFSSAQTFGIADGERLPDYFPVDDEHPRRAVRPYGLSKRLSEDLCAAFTARTGIPTMSLRPVAVRTRDAQHRIEQERRRDPPSEWTPFWEYGAFVDAGDVARAVELAIESRPPGHHRALLCNELISGSAPSLELAARLAPSVPIRNPGRYERAPSLALFECSVARRVLGWRPGEPGPLGDP